MAAGYSAALGGAINLHEGLPEDLTPEQKAVLKIMQKDLIKSKLEAEKQRKGALMDKLSQFHVNNNPGKVRFYESKLKDCLENIRGYEELLK